MRQDSTAENEICLFCNLTTLFTRYEAAEVVTDMPSVGQHVYSNVLKPKSVRDSLALMYGDSVGMSYKEGEMGDSQETF